MSSRLILVKIPKAIRILVIERLLVQFDYAKLLGNPLTKTAA